MERVCFQLQVKPDRIEDYKVAHAAVWPEMLKELEATGWHNYSIFLRPDGLVIGYFETPDLEAALEGMNRTQINAKWQAAMGELFDETTVAPDESLSRIPEVFNLSDQLAAAARIAD